MKQPLKIGIIGGGNMGQAMLEGFLKQGIASRSLMVADHKSEHCQQITKLFDVFATPDNMKVAKSVDVLILAIKPQQMPDVVCEIASCITHQLIVSIAAGVETNQIAIWLGKENAAIVRAMPNTPAMIGKGITALFANALVTQSQRESVQELMRSLGTVLWVNEESQMHVVTALSGSGPAYFFYMMENLIAAGEALGLSAAQAKQLTLQTALGSIQMALKSDVDLQALRNNVTSKGGTTERGIQTLQKGHFAELILQTVQQASERSREISDAQR